MEGRREGPERSRSCARMPPKRSAEDSAEEPKGKQKAARGAPADWRAPLFFWRGKVDGTTWEGTWVASTEGLPSEAEFASSPNAFKLTCSVDLGALFTPTNSLLNKDSEHFASFTGSYKLDNGDGLADYEDKEHVIWGHGCPPDHHPLSEGVDHWAVVGATGNTEFGRFVSLGRLDHPPDHSGGAYDPFTRLTLARRYIADNDKRTKMSARDVAGRICIRSLSKTTNRNGPPPDENFLQVPWLGLPWKLPGNWPLPLMPKKELQVILQKNCETVGTDWAVGVNGHSPFWKP